jgi:hypothetical protein
MRNSEIGDAWIAGACAAAPVSVIADGYVMTGPVRLGGPLALVSPKDYKGDKNMRYFARLLFPPQADLSVLRGEIARVAEKSLPRAKIINGAIYGIKDPLLDQGTLANNPGYTPGLVYMSTKAPEDQKPRMHNVPPALEPTDGSIFYPGCWAVAVVHIIGASNYNCLTFRLKQLVFYGHDTRLVMDDPSVLAAATALRAPPPAGVPVASADAPPAWLMG